MEDPAAGVFVGVKLLRDVEVRARLARARHFADRLNDATKLDPAKLQETVAGVDDHADPVVSLEAIRDFGLDPIPFLEQALDGANVAVITNNHSRFRSMAIETLSHRMASPAMFYDFWNFFNADYLLLAPHVGYMALGSHGRAKLQRGQGL